jgi:hypothetical protein
MERGSDPFVILHPTPTALRLTPIVYLFHTEAPVNPIHVLRAHELYAVLIIYFNIAFYFSTLFAIHLSHLNKNQA